MIPGTSSAVRFVRHSSWQALIFLDAASGVGELGAAAGLAGESAATGAAADVPTFAAAAWQSETKTF